MSLLDFKNSLALDLQNRRRKFLFINSFRDPRNAFFPVSLGEINFRFLSIRLRVSYVTEGFKNLDFYSGFIFIVMEENNRVNHNRQR